MLKNGVGEICCKVVEGKSISVDGTMYNLDVVMDLNSTQIEVYDAIGRPTILDVLHGYNGTIFAYGQTGSGKTFTMFGPDIYDEKQSGIIPRAANQIFSYWDNDSDTKEVDVRCSMLEIYNEDLRDLLNEDPVELKIKECPKKGIYVDGLSENAIISEQELMCWLEAGEERRVWAETNQNSVSSRSHTIFMLHVRQTLPNDSEYYGTLNIVDLAGSEKVGRSGAQGKIFQEGTKINLSLSALGNVIHSITSNKDHIPYRDSKLTRLLQESLGGNYKTTLIVACSPHSSQISETTSTLKFAQRAKKIKNNVKVNVKKSAEQLARQVEELRKQLKERDETIANLMSGGNPEEFKKLVSAQIPENYDNAKIDELQNENERLQHRITQVKEDLENALKDKHDLEINLKQAETDIIEREKKILLLEDKLKQVEMNKTEEDYYKNQLNERKKHENLNIEFYENQIKVLKAQIAESENSRTHILKDIKQELRDESLKFYKLRIENCIKKSPLVLSNINL